MFTPGNSSFLFLSLFISFPFFVHFIPAFFFATDPTDKLIFLFYLENGLLTPSMKLCRGPLFRHYKTIIEEQLYQAVENTQSALLKVLNETMEGGATVSEGCVTLFYLLNCFW